MSSPVVGIDPGGRWTGVVLRRGQDVVEHAVVTRACVGLLPDAAYLADVAAAVFGFLAMFPGVDVPVAVEGLNEPSPHMGLTNVAGLIGTGMVLGSILTLFPAAVVVPPGQNGSAPLIAYPSQLRPVRGKGAGKDMLRHCRSAYDVAGVARVLLRTAGAA